MAGEVPEMNQCGVNFTDLVNLAVGSELHVEVQDWAQYKNGYARDTAIVNEIIEDTFLRLGIEDNHSLKQLCTVIGRASMRRAFTGSEVRVSQGNILHPTKLTRIELHSQIPEVVTAKVEESA